MIAAALLASCNAKDPDFDAAGAFEAEETIVSAEATGMLKVFNIDEGATLDSGQYIGYIDSTQAHLRKLQLQAQAGAVQSRRPDIPAQLASTQAQLLAAQREARRMANLVKADAATPKQLDDANAQVAVLQRQLEAQRSSLDVSTRSIEQEATPLQLQAAQAADQLSKCRLVNPVAGTVLSKYAAAGEVVTPGRPLYKIADLGTIWLRAYVSADQLPLLRIGQPVTVFIDSGQKQYRTCPGRLAWISDKAEFTPKSIQTKSERANTVYAVKISVPNDGALKIGMYAEVKFQTGRQ
jgi:HlyD family secretion protein